ncbi:unnamed protein product, partial [Ilex paraguariensis]
LFSDVLQPVNGCYLRRTPYPPSQRLDQDPASSSTEIQPLHPTSQRFCPKSIQNTGNGELGYLWSSPVQSSAHQFLIN